MKPHKSDVARWFEVLKSESIQYPSGELEPADALRAAALDYARSLGWLDPKQAAEQDKVMAEYAAVHEADRADRERLERVRARVLEACEALAVAIKLTEK